MSEFIISKSHKFFMKFVIIYEQLIEPFSVSTPHGESILSECVYLDILIFYQSQEYHECFNLVKHGRFQCHSFYLMASHMLYLNLVGLNLSSFSV